MRICTGFSAAALVVLAACGGAGSSGVQPIEEISFNEINAAGNALLETYGDAYLSNTFTPLSEVPTSGSANFSGVIGIGTPEVATGDADADVIGQININAKFAGSANQLQGTASNFFLTSDGSALNGSLALDASISNTTGQFDGNISGTITAYDAASFDVGITGGFLGSNANAIAGSGVGIATLQDIDDVDEVGIIFAAE